VRGSPAQAMPCALCMTCAVKLCPLCMACPLGLAPSDAPVRIGARVLDSVWAGPPQGEREQRSGGHPAGSSWRM
jgi:hypothetical protein